MSGNAGLPARAPVTPFGEPLVDAATVAAYLSVDTTTIYRLAARAELPAIEVAPRVLRFRAEEVRAFVERRTRQKPRSGRAQRLLGPKP